MGGQVELDRAIEIIFGKLLGEIEFESLRNLKYLVEFEERVDSGNKKLVEAEASPLFLVSIHRSLVPPTALARCSLLRDEKTFPVAWMSFMEA